MEALRGEDISSFFQEIEAGFRVSPVELVVFLVLLGIFVGLLVAGSVVQSRRESRKRRRRAQAIFEHAAQQADLTLAEYSLAERLAAELPPEQKHKAVTEEALFDRSLHQASRKEPVSPEQAASLRDKLGFGRVREWEPIESTTDLSEGVRLSLLEERGRTAQGEVRLNARTSLLVDLDRRAPIPAQGEDVLATFEGPGGRYSFATRVKRRYNHGVELAHTTEVARSQMRSFHREPVEGVVLITPAGEQAVTRLPIVELSGGGASLDAGEAAKDWEPGDRFVAVLDLPNEGRVQVSGRVIRSSAEDRRLHLQFDPMRDAARDRIIAEVMRAERERAS